MFYIVLGGPTDVFGGAWHPADTLFKSLDEEPATSRLMIYDCFDVGWRKFTVEP